MKKLFLSSVIIISSLSGFTTFAQTPENKLAKCEQTECCGTADKCNDAKGHKGHHHDGKRKHHRGPRPDFFEGINLTPEQQSALSDIRPARCQNDKEQCDASTREEFKTKVKAILTPEQYAKFEQNMADHGQHKGRHERCCDKNNATERNCGTNAEKADRK